MWQLLVTHLSGAACYGDLSGIPQRPPVGPSLPSKPPSSTQKTPAQTQADPPVSDAAVKARHDADTIEEADKTGVLDKDNAAKVLRKDVLDLAKDTAGLGPALEALDEKPPNLKKAIQVIRQVTSHQIQRLQDEIDKLKQQSPGDKQSQQPVNLPAQPPATKQNPPGTTTKTPAQDEPPLQKGGKKPIQR